VAWRPLALALLAVAAVAAAAPADPAPYPERLPVEKLSWSELAATPGGPEQIERELRRQRIVHERWHQVHDLLGEQHLSRRGAAWLSERGLGPARVADPLAKVTRAGVDTLRILLVRISFATNREPDLVTMAPDGDFFYEPRYPDEVLQIDPEPHDRAYFEAHLQGLAEFYEFQSGGRLHIQSRVLPEDDRGSYQLSDVADYGPGQDGFWTLEGLESLVRDMITAADAGTQADGSADLSDYDDDDPLTYIIFAHAGSDWQSDIEQDTPNDIPTFFVTLGEPQTITGGELSECSVIPETTNQDGAKGSIAAALYHEFGHALGLPDVYDATTGLTSCGVWDLMDSGTNLAATLGYTDPESGELVGEPVTGILPPSLSAWCKWFLGWVETDHVRGGDGQEVKLPAVGIPRDRYSIHNQVPGNALDASQPQVLLGGMSSREFFLLENRWVPETVADTPYDPYDPETNYGGLYFKTDPATGVVLYLAGDRRGTEGINTGYYDYFLPQGGLLAWHADMDRIEGGLARNTINEYGDGLKLLEADGIQDIGVLDAYVLGWYGSDRDPFAPWNDAGYLEILPEGAGRPTSRGFDRSYSGLRVWDIADDGQAHGAVLSLRAALEPLAAGWPRTLPAAGSPEQPAPRPLRPGSPVTLARDGADPVLVAADRPRAGTGATLFAWTLAGAPAYDGGANLPPGAARQLSAPLAGLPARVDHAGGQALAVATTDGAVQLLAAGAAGLQELATVDLADSLQTGPQPVPVPGGDPLLCLVDGDGAAWLLDLTGTVVDGPQPVAGPGGGELVAPLRVLTDPAGSSVLVLHRDGWRRLPVTATGFGAGASDWVGRLDGPIAPALVPTASGWRLLAFGPGGLQWAWQLDRAGGWAASEWPDPGAALVGEPAVADLDGDGAHDVVAATAERLFAWQDDGTLLTGFPARVGDLFPLPDTTRIAGPLVVADLAGGPANELAFATARGHLFVLDGAGQPLGRTPWRFGGAAAAGLSVLPTAVGEASLALADAGGRVGPPLDRRLTHGRLALAQPRALPDGGAAPATAAWWGPAGGPARLGPVGTAAAVAGENPAVTEADRVVFYPNPLPGRTLNVRFYSATDRAAELVVYNLEGEPVLRARLGPDAGRVNEFTLDLDVASGLYVARLTRERAVGDVATDVKTLAVAR
jgi:M6 family metalloprotease-like protein